MEGSLKVRGSRAGNSCAIDIDGELIDLRSIFERFLRILNEATIYKKHRLRDPDTGKELSGLCDDVNAEIYINPKPKGILREPSVKILIHELSHYAFPKLSEEGVDLLEEFLWAKFTAQERRILYGYIPHHYSKKKPS